MLKLLPQLSRQNGKASGQQQYFYRNPFRLTDRHLKPTYRLRSVTELHKNPRLLIKINSRKPNLTKGTIYTFEDPYFCNFYNSSVSGSLFPSLPAQQDTNMKENKGDEEIKNKKI
jgi:hypothetical protein